MQNIDVAFARVVETSHVHVSATIRARRVALTISHCRKKSGEKRGRLIPNFKLSKIYASAIAVYIKCHALQRELDVRYARIACSTCSSNRGASWKPPCLPLSSQISSIGSRHVATCERRERTITSKDTARRKIQNIDISDIFVIVSAFNFVAWNRHCGGISSSTFQP